MGGKVYQNYAGYSNFKKLTFFRPCTAMKYKYIDSLFSDSIDWDLIQLHWKDLFFFGYAVKKIGELQS